MEIAKKQPKIVQITSAEAYYKDGLGFPQSHMTLFALDDEGNIWTRHYDGEKGQYREWFTLAPPRR
jgi:hypothetical protein